MTLEEYYEISSKVRKTAQEHLAWLYLAGLINDDDYARICKSIEDMISEEFEHILS